MKVKWRSILHHGIVPTLCVFLLAGCAMLPRPAQSIHTGAGGPLGSCADFFSSLDQRIEAAGALDPGPFRVKGYPYLRVNRFLSSFREEIDNEATLSAWVDQMQALDQDARKYEIENLLEMEGNPRGPAGEKERIFNRVVSYGDQLKQADFQSLEQLGGVQDEVKVPDEYISLRRVFGLYPLTSLFVYQGVNHWHSQARRDFSLEPPDNWRKIRYRPAKNSGLPSARQILGTVQHDALGVPQYSLEAKEALFSIYAPVWEVQTHGDYDRIGTPFFESRETVYVDAEHPKTYKLLSYTRFGNDILTQLNYIIWFPSRPKVNALDLFGGLIDGVTYRVTLDKHGKPLLYETIHNCGCYYKAYPTNRLRSREKIGYEEPPLILKAPEVDPSNEYMTVSMESRTHYIVHLYASAREARPETIVYPLVDYGNLRSLPLPGSGRASIFGQDSIMYGSERLERLALWPMGVLSPGAMRQWGRHAVALIGKRQFDDPFYMDKMFVKTDAN